MKLKTISLTIIAILLLASYGFNDETPTVPPPNKIDLTIKEIDGVWRVVDSSDSPVIIAAKGTQITWICPSSDVVFQFPSKAKKILAADSNSDDLPDGYTKYVKAGHKIKFHVKNSVRADTLEYAVFVIDSSKFAKGESPPKIIIR